MNPNENTRVIFEDDSLMTPLEIANWFYRSTKRYYDSASNDKKSLFIKVYTRNHEYRYTIGTGFDGTLVLFVFYSSEKSSNNQYAFDRAVNRLVVSKLLKYFNLCEYIQYRWICTTCRNLSKESMKQCAGCNCAHYCSVDCQESDWLEHKQICKQLSQ